MNVISAVLRFICGLVLIIAAYATYRRASGHVAAGEPLQIAGVTFNASPSELAVSLGVVGLIGLLLIVLGVVALIRKRT
jgi:hypothetical protein